MKGRTFLLILATPIVTIYLLRTILLSATEPLNRNQTIDYILIILCAFLLGCLITYLIMRSKRPDTRVYKIAPPNLDHDTDPTPPTHTELRRPIEVVDRTRPNAPKRSVVFMDKQEIERKYLIRFATMPKISRQHWTGKPTLYSECINFFTQAGLLIPDGQSYAWRENLSQAKLMNWLSQN